MTATLEVSGFRATEVALAELPKKLQGKVIRPAMRDGMKQIVLRDAQRLSPVRTGQLRQSLKVRAAKGRGNKRLPRGLSGYQVQAVKTKSVDAYYSGWVFLGATNRDGSKRPGTRTLRRALYGNAEAVRAYVTGKIKADLPKVVRNARIESLRYKG